MKMVFLFPFDEDSPADTDVRERNSYGEWLAGKIGGQNPAKETLFLRDASGFARELMLNIQNGICSTAVYEPEQMRHSSAFCTPDETGYEEFLRAVMKSQRRAIVGLFSESFIDGLQDYLTDVFFPEIGPPMNATGTDEEINVDSPCYAIIIN